MFQIKNVSTDKMIVNKVFEKAQVIHLKTASCFSDFVLEVPSHRKQFSTWGTCGRKMYCCQKEEDLMLLKQMHYELITCILEPMFM